MIALPETAFVVVAMMMAGTGLIFFWHDRQNPASRALAICLLAIGLRLFMSGPELRGDLGTAGQITWVLTALLDALAIYAGVDWGHRVALTGTYPPGTTTLRLFRTAKILIIAFCAAQLIYFGLAPERALRQAEGLSRISKTEWLLFGPVITLAMVLVGIAIARLRAVQIDEAESVRLQALSIAGPFLLVALFIHDRFVPLTLSAGLLIFIWGSVRFLVLQSRRGQFMRQFLSPEVAEMVQTEGMDRTLQRERRVLTVVACDLRGFTQFARQQPSDAVANLLERYYAAVGDVAREHGGTVKDHAGDGVLILVGAPLAMADHAGRAVMMALDLMRSGQQTLREEAPELGLGIGLATGNTTVGAIRGAGRLEYVAVGNAVNLAARLCGRAEDGEILSDRRTVEAMGGSEQVVVEDRSPEPLKGFAEPIQICALWSEAPTIRAESHKRSRRDKKRAARERHRARRSRFSS